MGERQGPGEGLYDHPTPKPQDIMPRCYIAIAPNDLAELQRKAAAYDKIMDILREKI